MMRYHQFAVVKHTKLLIQQVLQLTISNLLGLDMIVGLQLSIILLCYHGYFLRGKVPIKKRYKAP